MNGVLLRQHKYYKDSGAYLPHL